MLRIESSHLDFENGIYYLDAAPYSGIVYCLEGNRIAEKFRCSDGRKESDFTEKFFDSRESDLWIELEALMKESGRESEPFTWNGKRFDGIACEFDGAFCVGESKYRNGVSISEVGFDLKGNLEYRDLSDNGFFQLYEWDTEGDYARVNISIPNQCDMDIKFSDKNIVSSLSITGEYYEAYDKIKSNLLYPCPVTERGLDAKIQLGTKAFLAGSGITNQLIDPANIPSAFGSVADLTLSSTRISTSYIRQIVSLGKLSSLKLRDRKRADLEVEGMAIKAEFPDCLITANRVEIEI